MSTFQNKNILITGGASGIGKLMGKIAIQKGIKHLVIWDINKKMLDETVAELSLINPNVHGYIVDISNNDQIQSAAKMVKNDIGVIDILINNAGIVVGKYFHEHSHVEIEQTMTINSNGAMHTTLEFLSEMIKQNNGHIVTIASAAGMVGNPKMSVYAASKWAAMPAVMSVMVLDTSTLCPLVFGVDNFQRCHATLLSISSTTAMTSSFVVSKRSLNRMMLLAGDFLGMNRSLNKSIITMEAKPISG